MPWKSYICMIKRKIDTVIEEHFKSSRKALFLTGARQSGKTYAIRKYAKNNGLNLVEVNFLLQPDSMALFNGTRDVKDLLIRLSAYSNVNLETGKTLVFLDEVQECPDVMTWVKALVEEGSYMYALSGSLLGVELKDIRSIPVGYMSEYQLYPLDFEEFIRAVGISDRIIDSLRECWEKRKPVDGFIHDKMMQLFHLYLIVGGMPAAVQAYIDTNNMQRVSQEQRDILTLYRRDIGRYDSIQKLYINEIFELIPSELNAKNKRFILKRLNEHKTFSRHENDFLWLKDADMALPTYNVSEPCLPLKLSEQRNLFKLFQNDVGLLACQYADGIQLQILQGNVNINYGAIYENVVAQELHAHGYPLYYFNSKKQGELDFLLENDTEIIPVEVKSGKNYERHNALRNVLNTSEYDISQAFVLCNDNLRVVNRIIYLPIYMLMFISKAKSPQPLIYKIDIKGLA